MAVVNVKAIADCRSRQFMLMFDMELRVDAVFNLTQMKMRLDRNTVDSISYIEVCLGHDHSATIAVSIVF